MTRINLIPVEELYDQHLMAEYREIQHIPKSLQRSLKKKGGFSLEDIPNSFTLNKGHVKFFYDKGLYLSERFEELKKELKIRNFNIIEKDFPVELFPGKYFNNWVPSENDLIIIRERIRERINLKSYWYRYSIRNVG